MLNITDAAIAAIRQTMAANGHEGYAVRLAITARKADAFEYNFGSAHPSLKGKEEVAIESNGLTIFIAEHDLSDLEGVVIDLKPEGGFKIDNPNPVWRDPSGKSVAEVMERKINPSVAFHGGFITLVDVKDRKAYIKMGGGCQGCSLSNATLKQGIDKMIREAVPEIEEVIDITKHELGQNPYYTAATVPTGAASALE